MSQANLIAVPNRVTKMPINIMAVATRNEASGRAVIEGEILNRENCPAMLKTSIFVKSVVKWRITGTQIDPVIR